MYLALLLMAFNIIANAQEDKIFSPAKFDAALQHFITTEAKLTQQEALKFFPVYREMQSMQRPLFDRQRKLVSEQPQDEASSLKAIRERDEIEIEMKRIQKTYHERFLELLPASKVYNVIKAEDHFYRNMFRRFNHNQRSPHPKRQNNNATIQK
jgi:hypothetical protein